MQLAPPADLRARLRAALGDDVQFVIRDGEPQGEQFVIGVVARGQRASREHVRPCSLQYEVDEAWLAITELAEAGGI